MTRCNLQKFSVFVGVIVISALTPYSGAAQDSGKSKIVGAWNATADTEDGEKMSVITIKRSGDEYTGEYVASESGEKRELANISFEGKELKFEFELESQGEELLIKVVSNVDGNKLVGNWSALSGEDELASGSLKAEKKVATRFAGDWKTVAILPDGNTLESTLALKGRNNDLSGSINPHGDEAKIDRIKVDGNSIRMEFVLAVEGEGRNIVIDAKLDSRKSLNGKWILLDDAGDEEASGAWTAERSNAAKSDSNVAFDGSTLNSFRGYSEEAIGSGWKIENGVLHLDGTKSGDIITKQQFGDFELEFEWKISEGGNSGVMYRVSLGDKKPYLTGPEYQVLDDDKHKDGKIESHRSGSLYALYAPENKTLKPVGQWNTSKIVLKGNHVEHWLNEQKVVEAELGSDDWNARVADSKFKDWEKFGKNRRGHICFQDHGNPVWFRNIRIKSLD